MQHLLLFVAGIAPICREILQIVLSLWIQALVLIVFGLLAGKFTRKLHPSVSSFAYKSVLVCLVLTFFAGMALKGNISSLLSTELPKPVDQSNSEMTISGLPGSTDVRIDSLPATVTIEPSFSPDTPLKDASIIEHNDAKALDQIFIANIPHPVEFPALTTAVKTDVAPNGWAWLYLFLVVGYVSVACSLLGWMLVCHLKARKLCSRSLPVLQDNVLSPMLNICRVLGIKAPIALASDEVDSPFVCGVFKPILILPISMLSESRSEEMLGVLAHELTHLKENDVRWNLLARICCAVGWFQPLVWTLWKQLERSEEAVCDQSAISFGCSPSAYANCLLTLAESYNGNSKWRMQTGMALPGSELGRRIEEILNHRGSRSKKYNVFQKIGFVALLSLTMACAWNLVSAQSAHPQAPATETVGKGSDELPTPEIPAIPEAPAAVSADVEIPSTDLISPDAPDQPEPKSDDEAPATEDERISIEDEKAQLLAQLAQMRAEQAQLIAELAKIRANRDGGRVRPKLTYRKSEVDLLRTEITKLRSQIATLKANQDSENQMADMMYRSNSDLAANSLLLEKRMKLKGLSGKEQELKARIDFMVAQKKLDQTNALLAKKRDLDSMSIGLKEANSKIIKSLTDEIVATRLKVFYDSQKHSDVNPLIKNQKARIKVLQDQIRAIEKENIHP